MYNAPGVVFWPPPLSHVIYSYRTVLMVWRLLAKIMVFHSYPCGRHTNGMGASGHVRHVRILPDTVGSLLWHKAWRGTPERGPLHVGKLQGFSCYECGLFTWRCLEKGECGSLNGWKRVLILRLCSREIMHDWAFPSSFIDGAKSRVH